MLRELRIGDIPVVARFYQDIRQDTVPLIHDLDEIVTWMTSVLLPRGSSWVWTHDDAPVAWLDVHDGWVDQLYCARGVTGQGIGSRLLDHAKSLFPQTLQLYTFQVNVGAIRFYQRHGFTEVKRGDGSGNEEGQPDLLLQWSVNQKVSSQE